MKKIVITVLFKSLLLACFASLVIAEGSKWMLETTSKLSDVSPKCAEVIKKNEEEILQSEIGRNFIDQCFEAEDRIEKNFKGIIRRFGSVNSYLAKGAKSQKSRFLVLNQLYEEVVDELSLKNRYLDVSINCNSLDFEHLSYVQLFWMNNVMTQKIKLLAKIPEEQRPILPFYRKNGYIKQKN